LSAVVGSRPSTTFGGSSSSISLAADLSELRVEVAESVLMVALFQLGGLLVADAEDHLAALAVHLRSGSVPSR